jgi:hypothetical protein
VHVTLYGIAVLLLPLTVLAATWEREALIDPRRAATGFAVLIGAWLLARVRTAWTTASAEPAFDEDADRVVSLDVWDTRHASVRSLRHEP